MLNPELNSYCCVMLYLLQVSSVSIEAILNFIQWNLVITDDDNSN